jgi:hypothetical protein
VQHRHCAYLYRLAFGAAHTIAPKVGVLASVSLVGDFFGQGTGLWHLVPVYPVLAQLHAYFLVLIVYVQVPASQNRRLRRSNLGIVYR